MFWAKEKNKKKKIDSKVDELNKTLDDYYLTKSIKDNIKLIKDLFKDNDIFKMRSIESIKNEKLKFYIAYCEGLAEPNLINEYIVKPLINADIKSTVYDLGNYLINKLLYVNSLKKSTDIKEIIKSVTYGDTVLFTDGLDEAIILNTQGFQTRAINEPEGEKILSGPREGFSESLNINLSMIARKIRSNDLKIINLSFGRRTNTRASICYIDSIVNKEVLSELKNRLNKIDIDGVLDANYINELIKDSKFSLFNTLGYTERPDTTVGKLLEGRIAILVDGSPVALTLPYLFIENFQSNEDYYLNFYFSSYSRLLRILAFFLSISVPALYVAIVAFHQEMMPTQLLISIALERATVPFPSAVEAFFILIIFDMLRETGIRMPSNIGQALSVVGALVIGQAAVEAKLIAAPMIIVVGLTGITNLLNPKINAPIIYIRFGLLLLSSTLGLFGFLLGLIIIIIHISNLRSFGIPIISGTRILNYQDSKDILIRSSWNLMITRPKLLSENKKRLTISNGENND